MNLTVREVLQEGERILRQHEVPAADWDAQLLLADLLGRPVLELPLIASEAVPAGELACYRERIARRSRREPLQYILGYTEFMGLRFGVDRPVLIPRPETELLVETVLGWPLPATARVADVGTGSGAIAISLARLRPHWEVWASDLSPQAIQVARDNASRHGVAERLHWLVGDLMDPFPADRQWDVIVCNPPYIATPELAGIQEEVRQEPRLALDGGPDGLAIYRRLVPAAAARLAPGGYLGVEIGAGQAAAVTGLFAQAGLGAVRVIRDLAALDRHVVGRKEYTQAVWNKEMNYSGRGGEAMKVLFLVLNEEEYLNQVLTALQEVGVKGATIMESVGMGRTVMEGSHFLPLIAGLMKSLEKARPHNLTIFSVIESDDVLQRAVQVIQQIVGDLTEPGKGILFVLPVETAIGLAPDTDEGGSG